VSLATGGSITALSGLDFPNGLEVGEDGKAYVSEYSANGRVRMFDPYTGDSETILEIAHPNGLALSPDEQTLYVAVSEAQFSGSARVVAIERDGGGDWDASTLRIVYEADDLLDALAVDVCGNVYVTTYRTGHVLRLWTDGTVEELVDLPNVSWEGYCAARFGNGIGDWSRSTLYVSDRYGVYMIDVGIDGRHVLAP
jgi:gluconolactonase